MEAQGIVPGGPVVNVEPRFKQPAKPKTARRKPIPFYSERRFSRKELREALCAAVLERDRHTCRATRLVPSVACGGPLDVHEVIPRSAWKLGYLVMSNCLAVCRQHHDWIGDHPTDAHQLGLHGYSWERPDRKTA
jgi:hypothetical protein